MAELTLSGFLTLNRRVSQRWSLFLEKHRSTRWSAPTFEERLISRLEPRATLLDIGGGSRPTVPVELKEELSLHVIGLDVDGRALRSAPPGSYDEIIVDDAAGFHLSNRVDIVVSHYVVEHVYDVHSMFANIHDCLTAGGVTLHHVPNRYSVASVLNRLLPEKWKRAILFTLHPDRRDTGGYPAHYDRCSPSAMTRLLRDVGFSEVEMVSASFHTSYFKIFFPVHLAVTSWEFLAEMAGLSALCTDFVVEARK